MSGAYYNEIDPIAAQWLRNLIAAGHIAPGDVDERSIVDVRPGDLRGYTQCHFFAGVGVWSYALRCAGWADEWPVWTGSCPCQPFSDAGAGAGFDDERHLFPAWASLIGECGPLVVFGEQVASKDGLAWLDLVHSDLEAKGYTVGAVDLCAAGVGAPHIRQRFFFVADTGEAGRDRLAAARVHGRRAGALGDESAEGSADGTRGDDVAGRSASRRLADSDVRANERGLSQPGERAVPQRDGEVRAGGCSVADASSIGREEGSAGERREARSECHRDHERLGNTESVGRLGRQDHIDGGRRERAPRQAGEIGELVDTQGRGCGECGDASQPGSGGYADGAEQSRGVADPNGGNAGAEGLQRSGQHRQQPQDGGSDCAVVDSNGRGRENKDALATRQELDGMGPGPVNGFWRGAVWIPCRDGKARPIEPGTFPLAHGAPARVGRLRAYGNAINAEAAREFICAYLDVRVA